MASLTGRSAAKRAKRLANELQRRQRVLQRIEYLAELRRVQGDIVAGGTGFGLPGYESSGIMGVKSSVVTQASAVRGNEKELQALNDQIRSNLRKARKSANRLKIGIAVATIATMGATAAFGAGAGVAAGAAGKVGAAGATAGAVPTLSSGAALWSLPASVAPAAAPTGFLASLGKVAGTLQKAGGLFGKYSKAYSAANQLTDFANFSTQEDMNYAQQTSNRFNLPRP